tara:strand:+ start:295 stop:492 length:198 start_codon:yes stop_codon:yes gene_type:complete
MAHRFEMIYKGLLHRKSGVICANRDSHFMPAYHDFVVQCKIRIGNSQTLEQKNEDNKGRTNYDTS